MSQLMQTINKGKYKINTIQPVFNYCTHNKNVEPVAKIYFLSNL